MRHDTKTTTAVKRSKIKIGGFAILTDGDNHFKKNKQKFKNSHATPLGPLVIVAVTTN